MTAPCGAQTRDVHGGAVCDLEPDHPGDHSGEVVGGVVLCWSAAPSLSPREREIVARFEAAGDPFAGDLPPEWLVAYAPCGCVRAIRMLGYGDPGDAEFRDEFPACVEAAYWPRIKCPAHFPVVAA